MTGVHGLAALRQAMTDYLTAQGVESMTAWPKDRVGALTAPLAVVQVKEVEAGSAGFQNYLGQRYDAETRSWTEAFGQKVSVKFLVTLYSPRQDGERGCRALVDRVAEAFLRGGPEGFAVAGAICGGSDPALPLGGAELQGISALEKRLDESEVDALIRGGVTPVERVGGCCWVIRGVTTRTKTGQASDRAGPHDHSGGRRRDPRRAGGAAGQIPQSEEHGPDEGGGAVPRGGSAGAEAGGGGHHRVRRGGGDGAGGRAGDLPCDIRIYGDPWDGSDLAERRGDGVRKEAVTWR